MEKDQPERPDAGEDVVSDAAPADDPHTALPPKVEAWRRRSAAGAILTGFALGLQEALDTHRDEPSIVVQTSGDPPDDLPVEAEFEYGRPRQSVVSIRPWLMSERGGSQTAAGEAGAESSGGQGGSGAPADSGGHSGHGGHGERGPERPAGES